MRASPTTERGAPCRSDCGAALVEAALALPCLVLLFLGMLAVGGTMKTYSSTSNAVRAGGRMAALAGADPMTDRQALSRLATEAGGIRPDRIEYIVIWHATGPGAHVPAACVPAVHTVPNTASLGVSDGGIDAVGACNVYVRPADTGGAFDMVQGRTSHPADYYFGCQGAADPQAAHLLDCRWPGKDRRATTTPRATATPIPPDFVGLYLRVDHRFGAGSFGMSLTITETAINLIEPRSYGLT